MAAWDSLDRPMIISLHRPLDTVLATTNSPFWLADDLTSALNHV